MSRILSINVSKPVLLVYKGHRVQSSIRKQPVTGAVALGRYGLDGDQQADLYNHGGRDKGIYIYPSEHYKTWEEHLNKPLVYGTLGENLTAEGLFETELCVGDRLGIADAIIEITQPRIPCYKLEMSVQQDGFAQTFAQSCKLGSYAKIIKGGTLTAGEDIVFVHRAPERISVHQIAHLFFIDQQNYDALEQAVKLKALPHFIRDVFEKRLANHKMQGNLI